MNTSVSMEMSGLNQRKNGTTNRDVCSADITSVEPTKITPSQMKGGSQYLRKDFIVVGAPVSRAGSNHIAVTQRRPTISLLIECWTLDLERSTFSSASHVQVQYRDAPN